MAINIFVVGTIAALSAFAGNPKPSMKSLGDQVVCLCGVCYESVNNCNHYNCSTATEMRALIQKEIAGGKDETTILQDFVLHYGVQVLASPPPKGFNLVVWILPGVGLIIGLGVVILITRRWRKRPSPASTATPHSIDPKLLAAVEEEIKRSGIRG